MNHPVVDHLLSVSFRHTNARHGEVRQQRAAAHLELNIGRAGEVARTCGLCAAVGGRYDCESLAARREWRYTEAGVDLVASLIQRQPGANPRLRVSILVENKGRVHARAIYFSEPLSNEQLAGPFLLTLTSSESECESTLPACVEVTAGVTPSSPAGILE